MVTNNMDICVCDFYMFWLMFEIVVHIDNINLEVGMEEDEEREQKKLFQNSFIYIDNFTQLKFSTLGIIE